MKHYLKVSNEGFWLEVIGWDVPNTGRDAWGSAEWPHSTTYKCKVKIVQTQLVTNYTPSLTLVTFSTTYILTHT